MKKLKLKTSKSRLANKVGIGLALGSMVALSATSAAPLTEAALSSNSLQSVPQGIGAAVIANATPISQTDPAQLMTVSFILKANNLVALENQVSNGWTGPYLKVPQFAQLFGQSMSFIDMLKHYLGTYGIHSHAYPDRLVVVAEGTALQFDHALSVLLDNFNLKTHSTSLTGAATTKTYYGAKTNPMLPANLASNIVAILGLTNYQPFVSQALPAVGSTSSTSSTTQPSNTAPNTSITLSPNEHLPSFFVSHYNLTPLQQNGALGQGQTIGIVTLASLNPSVPETFWQATGVPASPSRIQLENVNGGAGPVSLNAGSDETTLDVEQSGSIAPDANVRVYQAPNTDYGFVDAFFKAASQNAVGSISASWGESETAIQASVNAYQESSGYAAAFNEAYLEAAAQGQSTFVSSGDSGAYTASRDLGTTNLSIDNPADSPYVTAAGGTTLASTQTYTTANGSGTETVTVPKEMGWNWGYLWPMYQALGFNSEASAATSLVVGSGGGYSSLFSMPSYQQKLNYSMYNDYQYLTPTNYQNIDGLNLPTGFQFNSNPMLAQGMSPAMRAVPDLSVNADPQTGYAVYDPQFQSVYGSSVVEFGGTSFSAPQLNGASAVIASFLGHRVGFWNPAIYKMAAMNPGTALTPLSSDTVYGSSQYSSTGSTTVAPGANFTNGNLFYTGTPGAIYNPATGLGIPNLALVAKGFAS